MIPAVSPPALGHPASDLELQLGLCALLAFSSPQYAFPLSGETFSSPDGFSSEPTHISGPSSPRHSFPTQLNYILCKHLPR